MTVDELVRHIAASPQHQHLYHFTDEANFAGINAHGILSKSQLRAKGLWPPTATGGNELSQRLDLERGIDPYVSLCMTRNHGMKFLAQQAGRLPKPHYLGINPAVLATPGVRVALGVANANDVLILPIAEAIAHMDIEVLYSRTDWTDAAIQTRLRAAEKFEVLVPTLVPRAMIMVRY
ncbi:hypothetical protein DK26_24080 [Bosea sp. WAO]|uniref:DarT ssDNA thymidine ADP-ribosyltransferase family protein n=1 Tax=Bosea sp. WAO TaxID=406341 RepID=UPI000748873E|nr:DarT ssDNA thymidine ADP-ribosyltransferase family protein [Bosea sp. WAO]KUL93397.1 hypothetical protein DK26_24080 [Bosea sp. WAO]